MNGLLSHDSSHMTKENIYVDCLEVFSETFVQLQQTSCTCTVGGFGRHVCPVTLSDI